MGLNQQAALHVCGRAVVPSSFSWFICHSFLFPGCSPCCWLCLLQWCWHRFQVEKPFSLYSLTLILVLQSQDAADVQFNNDASSGPGKPMCKLNQCMRCYGSTSLSTHTQDCTLLTLVVPSTQAVS